MVRVAITLLMLLLAPSVAMAAKRVALVVGNSAYTHTTRLENPKNDAADVAAALKKLGFEVIDGFDLEKSDFERKVRDFSAALRGAEAGVFFYAGHGLQVAGQNYLVPVDAKAETADALDWEMLRLDLVHRTMERSTSTNIIFLDACRNNPLARNLARAMGTRSIEIGRGLAPVESGVGTLISFSTQPGNVALDGSGRNSPFAGSLVRRIASSSDDLSALLIDVRNDVRKETQNKQVPWEHSALTGRFYFNPKPVSPPQSTAPQVSEAERTWPWVKDSTNQSVLENFIKEFGDTPTGALAKARLEELKKQQVAIATPPKAPTPEPSKPAQPSMAVTPASPLTRVLVAPVVGAPDAIAKQIQREFTSAVEKQGVSVTSGRDERVDYTLRGYIVAAKDKAATKVSYIWDITDPNGKRVNRITGEEVVSANAGKDPWAALTPQVAQSVAGKAASSFVAWLPSQSAQGPMASNVAISPTPSRCDGVEAQVGNERRCLKPKDSFKDCPECPEMVVVPAAEFMLGSPPDEPERSSNEGPKRNVMIAKPFAVGKFEATFAEWDACVAAGGCQHKPNDEGWGKGRRPVINVSWDDAKEYVAWMAKRTGRQYRLLAEAEWECAARAGTTASFSTGRTITQDQANFDGRYSYGGSAKGQYRQKTVEVGSFKPNAFGLHDMHGNVWEWVEDCYHDSYQGAPTDGSAWTSGDCSRRVVRGGSWSSYPGFVRAAIRVRHSSDNRSSGQGFRLARTLNP